MDAQALVVNIFIAIGIIWIVQTVLTALNIKEPGHNIIFVVTIILMVLFIVSGQVIPLR